MTWAHYLLQVNIYLVVFYAFYRFLLEKETYFQLNRIYLIASVLFAFCIPFISLDWLTQESASQQLSVTVGSLDMMVLADKPSGGFASVPWGSVIAIVYIAGLLFFLARFCLQLYTIKRSFQHLNNQPGGIRHQGKVPGSQMAYSFFRHKFVHQDLPGKQTINKHEDIHIQQHHTLDVLFFELVALLNWFNPVAYFYKTAAKNNHEFLADEAAADYQGDKQTYALLLLSAAFKVSPHALTNSFFSKQSLIKKRIYMLHKEKSKGAAILKFGLYLPLFSGVLLLSSATLRQNEKLIKVTGAIPIEDPFYAVKETLGTAVATTHAAQDLSFEATYDASSRVQEWEPFYEFVGKSVKYPEQARQQQIQGNAQTKFTLENGAVKGLEVLTKLGAGIDAEVMKVILSYKDFKGQADGNYVLNMTFKLDGANSEMHNEPIKPVDGFTNLKQITIVGFANATAQTNSSRSEVMDFTSVDTPPSFPGGLEKFYTFIGKSVKYPAEAVKNNVQGKVFLSYIVEKDGSLSEVQLAGKKLGYGTDEEAIRVLQLSPKWNPGLMNGKPVRVKYHIPISFTLSKEDSAGEKAATEAQAPALQGKVTNVTVTKTSESSNGKVSSLKITSPQSPTYIIDGVQSSKEALEKLSSDDIERIDVVKSAAGESGTGVINITTKKN